MISDFASTSNDSTPLNCLSCLRDCILRSMDQAKREAISNANTIANTKYIGKWRVLGIIPARRVPVLRLEYEYDCEYEYKDAYRDDSRSHRNIDNYEVHDDNDEDRRSINQEKKSLLFIDVTIATPRHTGIASTSLIQEIVSHIPALKCVLMVAKHLLKTHDIGDPSKGGLSPYALFLLSFMAAMRVDIDFRCKSGDGRTTESQTDGSESAGDINEGGLQMLPSVDLSQHCAFLHTNTSLSNSSSFFMRQQQNGKTLAQHLLQHINTCSKDIMRPSILLLKLLQLPDEMRLQTNYGSKLSGFSFRNGGFFFRDLQMNTHGVQSDIGDFAPLPEAIPNLLFFPGTSEGSVEELRMVVIEDPLDPSHNTAKSCQTWEQIESLFSEVETKHRMCVMRRGRGGGHGIGRSMDIYTGVDDMGIDVDANMRIRKEPAKEEERERKETNNVLELLGITGLQ